MIGGIVQGIGSIVGGVLNQKASAKTNETTWKLANLNRADQYRFAREGIRWRVEDAKAAGIHPVYALGASGPSYSPVSANFHTPNYDFLGRAGAGFGNAIDRTVARKDRLKAVANEEVRKDAITGAQVGLMDAQREYYTAAAARANAVGIGPGINRSNAIAGQGDSGVFTKGVRPGFTLYKTGPNT